MYQSVNGGSTWESNPPSEFLIHPTGFEDRAARQRLTYFHLRRRYEGAYKQLRQHQSPPVYLTLVIPVGFTLYKRYFMKYRTEPVCGADIPHTGGASSVNRAERYFSLKLYV